jgi:hypothetical protein
MDTLKVKMLCNLIIHIFIPNYKLKKLFVCLMTTCPNIYYFL